MRSRSRIYASPVLWGLLLGAAVGGALGACASTPRPVPGEADMRKQEIQDLWMQIRDWRVGHNWSAEPAIRTFGASVPELRKCKAPREPSTETCQDICTLRDAICDNAQDICRIAGQLEGDAWADEKCKSAKASCKEATQKCCQCTAAEQPGSEAPADRGRPPA